MREDFQTDGVKKIRAYVKLIRAYQWTKSAFIFLPFVFSDYLRTTVQAPAGSEALGIYRSIFLAFLAFSFVASSVYIINDYRDRELDREDPRKKKRPLASGAVSPMEALVILAILFTVGFFIAFRLGSAVMILIGIYFLLNIFYNIVGKRIILLDVFIISLGYVFRVLVGSSALDIEASPWILSTTFFIALFLGFFKRYYEVLIAPPETYIGGTYDADTLRHFTSMTAALAILNYSVYCIQGPHADAGLVWTIPLVVLGIFRYYVLLQHPEELEDGNPSDLLLRDRFLIIVILAWVLGSAALMLHAEFSFLQGVFG